MYVNEIKKQMPWAKEEEITEGLYESDLHFQDYSAPDHDAKVAKDKKRIGDNKYLSYVYKNASQDFMTHAILGSKYLLMTSFLLDASEEEKKRFMELVKCENDPIGSKAYLATEREGSSDQLAQGTR